MTANYQARLGFRARKYEFDPEQLREWRRRGLTWEQIARKYGPECDCSTVRNAAARLGAVEPRKLVRPADEAAQETTP